jgi:hypothetical protein
MNMAHFRVLLRQDAWINHEAVIEAVSKEEAIEFALDAWKGRRDDIKLVESGHDGFDHAEADPDEVEELTAEQLAECQSKASEDVQIDVLIPTVDAAVSIASPGSKTRFEEARDTFIDARTHDAAAAYLKLARQYYGKDLINNVDFRNALGDIQTWLERF